jgi:hypothetical protein
MNAITVVKTALEGTKPMLGWYLGDLSDAELLIRPVAGANHIAWQIGHLILSEIGSIKKVFPDAVYPELPEGFEAAHKSEASAKEDATGYLTKAEYLALYDSVRSATVAVASKLTEADLDKETGLGWAKTAADLFLMTPVHDMMHVGQFTVVRRKLGKPRAF